MYFCNLFLRNFGPFFIALAITLAAPAQEVSTLTGGFSASGGVRTDADGNIFVADFGPNFNVAGTTIYRITPAGDVSIYSQGVVAATGGNFDSQGNLFWSSFNANRIDRIHPDGSTTFFAGVAGPVAIAVDTEDNLFVASCNNNSIVKITPSGSVSTFATSPFFSCANGLTFDNEGNLFESNFNDGRVHKITPDGAVSLFATIPGNNAVNIAFAQNHFYVTARAVHQIYRITKTGEVSLLAGNGVRGNADGPWLQASFSLPNGIAPSPDGKKLYVNDAVPLTGSSFHPSILRVIELPATGINDDSQGALPREFSLEQNFPNPFNPTTRIEYSLTSAAQVTLRIYNGIGEEVRTLINQQQIAGTHSAEWDSRDHANRLVPSGIYLYTIQAGPFSAARKMTLVR